MKSGVSQAQAESRAAVIKALSHPSRVLIAEALSSGELCVADLTDKVGADISTVSKHLLVMKQVGLVVAEKRGLHQFYRLCCPCLKGFFACVDDIAKSHVNKQARRCC